jgi:EVE domain/AT hook motif
MPPKKRGRPPVSSSATPQRPTKRVRVGDTSIIGTQSSTEVTESGRPKRSSAGEPNYNTTRARAPNGTQAANQASTPSSKTSAANKPNVTRKRKPASKLFGKRRPSATANAEADTTEVAKPKRGRPKKVETIANAAGNKEAATTPARGQGRPKKVVGRGRPKKEEKEVKSEKAVALTRKIRKAPTKPSNKEEVDSLPSSASSLVKDDEEPEANETDRQYWLMKAEPDSRIEKGVDVKFSIDDLQAKGGPEAWDGVRNYGARNNMRAMRIGDRAFFYHSNCKVPGIAGVIEIVGEHSIDGMWI